MPELVSPKKKRASAEKVQATPDSKGEDSAAGDENLNKEEMMEIIVSKFKSPEIKLRDFEQKFSQDQEYGPESTCLKSKVRDTKLSSSNNVVNNIESKTSNSGENDSESSTLNTEAKDTESSSLIEDTEMKSPNGKGGKSGMMSTVASGASNKRGLSSPEGLLKPVEKKKRKEYSDKSVQVFGKIGSFISEDPGKTSTRVISSQSTQAKSIFEEANPLPNMLKFEESIETFILDSQFKFDRDSACESEELSLTKDSDEKLYEFWKQIKVIVWSFHNQVRSVAYKFGPFCKLTPEELKDCIDSMKESTNEMRKFYDICVKELRNWWNLTKIFDGSLFFEALLHKIYCKVKNLEYESLTDENSELSSNSESKCLNDKPTSNRESRDSEATPLTSEAKNAEMKSLIGKVAKTSLLSTSVVKLPPNKRSLSVDKLLNYLEKNKLESPEKITQILKQLFYSAGDDEILTKDVLSAILKPPRRNISSLDVLEKVNLLPAMLKFERTIETFLFCSEFGLDSVSKSDSNPKLVELWKKTEGTVLDFKKQVQAVISKLGPLCELTLDDLKNCVCNLKRLSDKMEDSRKVCFKELKQWWNLTQVFNNMFALEVSLNDIFSKIKELEATFFYKIKEIDSNI